MFIPQPEAVDLAAFDPQSADRSTRYGLPSQVRFCVRCVISNQRPSATAEFEHRPDSGKDTIEFDDDGVCFACNYNRSKESVDWEDRDRQLREICDRYRRNDGRYDCIIPGSGGKDTFFNSHTLKTQYGMHPLTVTWAPNIYTDWGWRNFQRWIHAGFDNYLCTPNGRTHRLLTRLAVERLFHPFQPFIFGQKQLAPRMALLHDVQLVFYSEPNAEYGTRVHADDSSRRNPAFFSADTAAGFDDLYIGGVSIRDLKQEFGLEQVDLEAYLPADRQRLEEAGVHVHYLGHYVRWHPQSAYYYAVEHGGFEASPERNPGTYSKYNSIDDRIDDFHYYATMVKFGIGRATYDAAQEIRNGDIDRDEGVALTRRYDGEFPERFADEIFHYLSLPADQFPVASKQFAQPVIDREYFDRLADAFRPPHLWNWQDEQWKLRHAVWDGAQPDPAASAQRERRDGGV